jgi:hypothetical protein
MCLDVTGLLDKISAFLEQNCNRPPPAFIYLQQRDERHMLIAAIRHIIILK